MEAVKRNVDVIIALDFKERVTSEPQGFLDCFYRHTGTAMETLHYRLTLLSSLPFNWRSYSAPSK